MPKLFRSAFPLDGGPVSPEQILAFHRATFGSAQMNDAPSEPAGATGSTAPAAEAAPAAPTAQAPAVPAETGKVEDLPEWAQKIIRDSRDEAGKARTTAKANAAAEARTALAQEIGKALGLVKDDETPDPAKLTEQLTTAQTAQRAALVELAVFKAAGNHKADPAALLDSRAFLASVTDLDPSGSDFAAKVDAAIKAAVDGNPKLKAAAQAAGASTIPHAGGSGEGGVTKDEFNRMTVAQKTALYETKPALYRQLLGIN